MTMAERELSGAPSMLPMFARAGASMIPGASLSTLRVVLARMSPLPSIGRPRTSNTRPRVASKS